MMFFGTKVPMERTANGFRTLEDDALFENVIQFFMKIHSNPAGTGGEVEWDHRMGTPWELARHKNIRAGMIERYVAITLERFKAYAGEFFRFTSVQRIPSFGPASRLLWEWRNVLTGKTPEEATDVQFAE